MFSRSVSLFVMSLAVAGVVAACSPLGIATGAGAAVGVAAAQDGGLRSTARDIGIKAAISDLWFKYDVDTFAKLNLTVTQGRVLITGVVQDPEDRVEAVRRAWQVKHVNQVINEIQIAESEGVSGFVRDTWISTRLRAVITLDKYVQSINYSIDTVSGVVYLMGVAQNQSELNHVIELARTVPNVKQVISYVRLKSEPAPGVEPAVNPAGMSAPSAVSAPTAVERETLE